MPKLAHHLETPEPRNPLLVTKLHVPRPRAHLVPRPHLVERLQRGAQHPEKGQHEERRPRQQEQAGDKSERTG